MSTHMAASAEDSPSSGQSASLGGHRCPVKDECVPIIKPTITELTKEVRTNILCTVEGCGKILRNTPALNMHLVKSHRVKDGIINPTVRKDMKAAQKLYCCPIEGCPRGPFRPFSQFSLVKQHFMKMHAEKKHKCSKCNNGYSTEWDLRRHIEDCGKTYHCTCGCPYASRAALLSHIYRTGHEIPTEHRIPPVKKRKMEKLNCSEMANTESSCQITTATSEHSDSGLPFDTAVHLPDSVNHGSNGRRSYQKLLLPKPKMALVSVPVMQVAHLPVLLPSTDSGTLRSVVLAVDGHGSLSTLHLLPQAMAAVVPQPDGKSLCFKDGMPTSRSSLGSVNTGVQVCLQPAGPEDSVFSLGGQRGRSTSTNIQTDKSYLSRMPTGVGVGEGLALCSVGESSVSSCSQTDISVSAQVLLPVSVETQTFSSRAKSTSTIGAQTDSRCASQIASSSSIIPPYKTRQTQTYGAVQQSEKVDCSDLFGSDSLTVSTQTASLAMDASLTAVGSNIFDHSKSVGGMCFGVQTDELNSTNMADNQTQTMTLLNDLENILSEGMSGHQVLAETSVGCGSGLGSVQEQHNGIDFDFEEFLSAVHIQTQTEESELRGLGGDTPLESLDIQTQTDFLLMDELEQNEGTNRGQASDLELEMFDTQTQTDLNFLLNAGSHMPLSSILHHSSFSMSTESSDTETQTDIPSLAASLSAQTPMPAGEHSRLLNSTETQTMTSQGEGLGHLFLTSNETQTVMDDFLSADLAWNMESHFSSVETQTCEELCALFQHPEKPNS